MNLQWETLQGHQLGWTGVIERIRECQRISKKNVSKIFLFFNFLSNCLPSLSLLLMSARDSTQPYFQFAIHSKFGFNFYSNYFSLRMTCHSYSVDDHNPLFSCSSTGVAFFICTSNSVVSFILTIASFWPYQIDILLGGQLCKLKSNSSNSQSQSHTSFIKTQTFLVF